MATILNTAFEARVTNNQFDTLANITGLYQESSAPADCPAGLLCVRGENLPCEGFEGVLNENAYYMTAAADDVMGNEPIYACNMYEANLATVKNNKYFIGMETLGLPVPAGRYGTFTRIIFDGVHKYRFGVGNFSAAIGDNGFAVMADDGLMTPAASAPSDAGTPYFVIKGTGNFVEGTTNSFGYVDVEAHLA